MSNVPAFYRIFFAWLDPILAAPGACINFIAPQRFLGMLAGPIVHFDPNTVGPYHHLGGLYLMLAFLSATIPRTTSDIRVWKLLQWGILIVDFASISGLYTTLNAQNRLSVSAMTQDDWQWAILTPILILIRSCFIAEVGFSRSTQKKRA